MKFLYEGFVCIDVDGKEVLGVVKDWIIFEDGLKYVFNLNLDVKWSNGDVIIVEDFVCFWECVLKLEMVFLYVY